VRKLASSFLVASAAFALLAAPPAIFVSEAGAQENAGSGPAPKEVFDALKAIDDALNEQMKVAAPPGQPLGAPAFPIARRIKELFKSFPAIYGLEFPAFLNFVSAIDRGLGQAVQALDAQPPDVAAATSELAAAASETDKLRKAVKDGGAPAGATDPLVALESQITQAKGDLGTTASAVAKSKQAVHARPRRGRSLS
jgi:hypothetical protein